MSVRHSSSNPDCYGKMFPSVAGPAHNRTVRGKAFGFRRDVPGVVASRHAAVLDAEAWQQCVACPNFDACYRLSLGALLMEMALKG